MRPGSTGSVEESPSSASPTTSCPACVCSSRRSCPRSRTPSARRCQTIDLLHPLPPFFTDRAPRPIDDKLWTLTARRPVGEWVFANAAQNARGVTIRRGVSVDALLTGPSAIDDVPHVAGVRTSNSDEIRSDLVVDATGRQSRSPQWLTAIGARPPYEEQEDCGFTYYTRYFRGSQPQRLVGALMPLGSISLLTLPGDHDTWSVTIFVATGDQPLKNLRHEEQWTKAIRACPLHSHWPEGEPMHSGSGDERHRRSLSPFSSMARRSQPALSASPMRGRAQIRRRAAG